MSNGSLRPGGAKRDAGGDGGGTSLLSIDVAVDRPNTSEGSDCARKS